MDSDDDMARRARKEMLEADTTYNGWRNRTTWALHLWLTNDHDTYLAACAWAGHANDMFDREGQAAAVSAFQLHVRNNWHGMPNEMRMDVGNNLSDVDWASVMESFLEGR